MAENLTGLETQIKMALCARQYNEMMQINRETMDEVLKKMLAAMNKRCICCGAPAHAVDH